MSNNKILIILLVLLMFVSCEKNNNKPIYPYKIEKMNNGKRIIENHINDSSLIKTTYNQDKVESIIRYSKVSNRNEWLQDKDFVYFYPSRQIEHKGSFDKGLRIGRWYYYDVQGMLSLFEEYVIDSSLYGENVNQFVNYRNGKIDINKENRYFDIITLQDSILESETFMFKIQLHEPMYSQGMFVRIGDYDEYYRKKEGGRIDTIRCKSFNEIISYRNHKKGKNEIRGIIINYDSVGSYRFTPYFFKINYYVGNISD